jgi:cell division protein FtsA
MEEIFRMIRIRIEKMPGTARMTGGVVRTGGGSLLPGAADVASQVFDQPSRVGKPRSSVDWPEPCRDPKWSTAAGLILMGDAVTAHRDDGEDMTRDTEPSNLLKGLVKWLGEFF